MLFLRSIQLDASDASIYQHAASPGEWAVPGSFVVMNIDPDTRDPGQREALRHGFVGTESFGHTSLVEIDDISPAQLNIVRERITRYIREHGAPSESLAQQLAEDEIGFTLELANHPAGTRIAVERHLTDDGIEESYRTVSLVSPVVDHSQVRLWGPEE